MIRFSCPGCGRAYILADALAHLPLLCKGCGQRLNVPEPSPEPPPEPEPPPIPKPKPQPKAEPAFERSLAPPPPATPPKPAPALTPVPNHRPDDLPASKPESVVDLFLSPVTMTKLDQQPEMVRQPVPAEEAEPAPPGVAANPGRTLKVLAWVVDGIVALALLAAGALVGEVVAKKATREILTGAASAPKFPPTDLLLWLGCVACFGLIYLWLGTRGWTAGALLRRKAT